MLLVIALAALVLAIDLALDLAVRQDRRRPTAAPPDPRPGRVLLRFDDAPSERSTVPPLI